MTTYEEWRVTGRFFEMGPFEALYTPPQDGDAEARARECAASAPFGVWRTRQRRWMWVYDHDSLFVAAARWRMRISKRISKPRRAEA